MPKTNPNAANKMSSKPTVPDSQEERNNEYIEDGFVVSEEPGSETGFRVIAFKKSVNELIKKIASLPRIMQIQLNATLTNYLTVYKR